MIFDLPDTTTSAISRKIDELHEQRGEAAIGRVLTLLISVDAAHMEKALETANEASREHPCRVIAILTHEQDEDATSSLDAQIRFGADAGAGEIILLRPHDGLVRHLDTLVIPLLVPDAPVVAWWPGRAPENPSQDAIGAMARSRITDACHAPNPEATFTALKVHYAPEDVDMAWTRLTTWRALLVSMLEQPPHLPISSVRVTGQTHYLPLDLLASWLALKLDVPVHIDRSDDAVAVTGVYFEREDGILNTERKKADHALIQQPGEAEQNVSMPVRTMGDCLSEELRRLDPDELYGEVISRGWQLVDHEW